MLSLPHLVVIFLVALIVLGPEKLPEVARTMGKMMAQFRRVTGDFRYQIESEVRDLERQARIREAEQYERTMHGAMPHPIEHTTLPAETPVNEEPAAVESAVAAARPPAPPENPSDGESHSG